MPNVLNSTHFHIEYDTISGGLTINNYRDALEAAWSTEITSFGFAAPPVLTSNPPPGNRYHVRIDAISARGVTSTNGVHAGLVGDNPNTSWTEADAYASCIVLLDDFSGLNVAANEALRASSAHELHHATQMGYGALSGSNVPDMSFVEGSAAWMEDEVRDGSNANYRHLWPVFTSCMGEYGGSNEYSYWLTFRGLSERYGSGTAGGAEQVMQDFWEDISQGISQLAAMSNALSDKGTSLAAAFHAYAIAVKFNRACGGSYAYPYCLEEGPAYVTQAGATTVQGTISALNNSYSGSVEDNYALNWVQFPVGSQEYNAYLISSGAEDLRASLVCDTGSQFRISAFYEDASTTDTTWVTHFDPTGCTSIVVVITNEWTTSGNPASCGTTAYQVQATNVVYVNRAAASPGYGTSAKPYPTVASGVPDVPVDGVLSIAAGSYNEIVTIDTPMTVQATGGTATIGQ
jgi:hypothetical protein